jgi:hypothetical protein
MLFETRDRTKISLSYDSIFFAFTKGQSRIDWEKSTRDLSRDKTYSSVTSVAYSPRKKLSDKGGKPRYRLTFAVLRDWTSFRENR